MHGSDEKSLHRHVVPLLFTEQAIDAKSGSRQGREASDRHNELGRSDIAKRFQLPLVALELVPLRSVPNLLCPISEEGVRNFVREGIPDTSAWPRGVILNARSTLLARDRPRI